MAPTPVHPIPVRMHGLFGPAFVQQHAMVDSRWTTSALTEQFKNMADLLGKRRVFNKLENKASRKRLLREYRDLRRQCRDGRVKLHMSLFGKTVAQIRTYLINHKDMQRLYQHMPPHLVVDNINQRTFLMRKERDRMQYRLKQLKSFYEGKLMEGADLENRIKYQNEFVLEEEVKSITFHKKIAASLVRLKAIKTVNSAYLKMIQVLRHDANFYEPILRSLDKDTEDQAAFIKHVLYIGMPGIAKFRELAEEYRLLEEKARKNLRGEVLRPGLYATQWVTALRKDVQAVKDAQADKADRIAVALRYVRETPSMNVLKSQLDAVEDTIKKVKFTTLCSQARDVYPRMKSQLEHNKKLQKSIENDELRHQFLDEKLGQSEECKSLQTHNWKGEAIKRMETIEKLKKDIEVEDEIEAKALAHMKNRAAVYILLRFTLWNLEELLRHVGHSNRSVAHLKYPKSYLELPLLKFDMLNMRAVPPEPFDDKFETLMHLIKRKVGKLMKAYNQLPDQKDIRHCRDEYHKSFIDNQIVTETTELGDKIRAKEAEAEQEEDLKISQKIPDNTSIKALSRKLVEELSKKDE